MSDALFGVDGTELPSLSRDPTGRGSWGDVSVPPPVPLPPIPELNMTREAIAAALGEDPGESGGQEQAAPAGGEAAAAAPSAVHATVELPTSGASPQPRPVTTALVSPVQSSQRAPGGPGYLRHISARSGPRVQLRSPGRRFARPIRSFSTQTRSNGGAGVFFIIMMIVFAVLLYFIIAGIIESFARLIP